MAKSKPIEYGNICFLNIDGVLNNDDTFDRYRKISVECGRYLEYICFIDADKVNMLVELCKRCNAQIVLTDSWRGFSLYETRERMENYQEIAPLAPYVCGGTMLKWLQPRHDGISEWLESHTYEKYCIIDNEDIGLENEVICDKSVGLTEENVKSIENILK